MNKGGTTVRVTLEDRISGPKVYETEMIDNEHFKCPVCGEAVLISYWTDSRGKHPKVGLTCESCKSMYGINFVK